MAGGNGGCNEQIVGRCEEGIPATQAHINPGGIAVGRDGSLYIAGTHTIRRVTPDGIIRTIAGPRGLTGVDGIPPTEAQIFPSAVAVGDDDTVYLLENPGNRLRWFRPGGLINTLAGNGVAASNGDGGPARRASITDLWYGLAVAPDGSVYFSQSGGSLPDRFVRRVSPVAERFSNGELVVPAKDGSEMYVFTQNGRHLRTVDALTGALAYQFSYDALGQLATITDRSGNVTTIERDAQGVPVDILGPYGQRTMLDLDADGYLSRVTNPANESVQLGYTSDGLLSSFMRPGGQTSTYGYGGIGRLISATDPAGNTKTLTRTGTNKDHTVTLTSPLGRVRTFHAERLSNRDLRLTNTDAAGAQSQWLIGQDGTQSGTEENGTTTSLTLGADPRWGMRAPIPASFTITTPNGLSRTTTITRSIALASPGDLLHLSTLSETTTTNGRSFTTAFDAATRSLTRTSPSGLQENIELDTRGAARAGAVRRLSRNTPIPMTRMGGW